MNWTTIRRFHTKRFSVALMWAYEDCPDISWADDETKQKLDDGTYINCMFRVSVYFDGTEIAADYLGNSVYSDPVEFSREHFGIKPKGRADGCNYGCYFPDMITQAISEARKALCNVPRIRCS